MLHFCCADNIVATVLRYLPKFSSTVQVCGLSCCGLWSVLLSYLWRNPYRQKEKAEKVNFIYGKTFKKNESGRDFQRVQIWNDCSQKQKKNYGSYPLERYGTDLLIVLQRASVSHSWRSLVSLNHFLFFSRGNMYVLEIYSWTSTMQLDQTSDSLE